MFIDKKIDSIVKYFRVNTLWIMIFLLTQLSIFTWNYREFETKFFPVVTNFEVVHIVEQSKEFGTKAYTRFDKNRECIFIGLRMTDPTGWRIKFTFLDDIAADDSYKSRGVGHSVAGPWWIDTDNWSNMLVESVHKCDPFGVTISVMQKPKLL
tara:strand:- start:514 stop:972 length:459 start_codon:yes stop_codon:yes gene_type:complete